MKRNPRPGPAKPAPKPEPKPAWGPERHSGEGSASALETLQKLEKRRLPRTPAEPPGTEEPKT